MKEGQRVDKRVVFVSIAFAILFAGCTKKRYKEKYYQTQLCNELGGVMEQSLLDRSRVDCLTDEYAIEVDFARKWAEGAGQALYYALMTDKKPAVGLIVRDSDKDRRRVKRFERLAKKYAIKLYIIQREQ